MAEETREKHLERLEAALASGWTPLSVRDSEWLTMLYKSGFQLEIRAIKAEIALDDARKERDVALTALAEIKSRVRE